MQIYNNTKIKQRIDFTEYYLYKVLLSGISSIFACFFQDIREIEQALYAAK